MVEKEDENEEAGEEGVEKKWALNGNWVVRRSSYCEKRIEERSKSVNGEDYMGKKRGWSGFGTEQRKH